MPRTLYTMPATLNMSRDDGVLHHIETYKNRVEAMQITLHMSSQKAALVLQAKKLDDVPRLKAIQDEMNETVVLVQALYNNVRLL